MRRYFILFLVVLIGCASPLVEQLKVDLKYGRIDAAIEHGEEAVMKEPDNAIAHFLLAQAYMHKSRWSDAASELDAALELDSALIMTEIKEDPGFYWTAYYNVGIELMKEGIFQDASKSFIKATRLDSSKPEAYNNLAYTYLMLGDEQKMLESYTKVIEIDSTNIEAYYNLGFYYTNKGDYETALNYIEKAEKLAIPILKEYEDEFFKLTTRPLEPKEKKDYLKKLFSEEETKRKELLTSELGMEDAERGLEILNKIEQKTQRLGEIMSTKGLIYLNTQRKKEAVESLKKALAYVEDDPDTYFYLILALQRQEKYEDALPYLKRMNELFPSDVRGWFQLGVSYFRTEQYDDAIKAFTKVIELNPNYSDAYINRGNVYARKADLMAKEGKKKEEMELRRLATQDFEKADQLEKTEGAE